MKKTVVFDNNNIILGFGDGNIDPIETKKIIEPKLKESAEAKKLESNNKTIQGYFKNKNLGEARARHAFQKYGERVKMAMSDLNFKLSTEPEKLRALLNSEEQKILSESEFEIKKANEQIQIIQNENIELFIKLDELKKSLIENEPVYFEPRSGEKLISISDYDLICEFMKASPKCEISFNGDKFTLKEIESEIV